MQMKTILLIAITLFALIFAKPLSTRLFNLDLNLGGLGNLGGGAINNIINEATTPTPPPPLKNETTDIGGNMKQRDYQTKSGGTTYRELYCKDGYKMELVKQWPGKIMNQCGPHSWQRLSYQIHDQVNVFALSDEEKDCCDEHDACYAGYTKKGQSMIQNGNKLNNEICETNFQACHSRLPIFEGGTPAGKLLHPATATASPNYFGPDKGKNFKCVAKPKPKPKPKQKPTQRRWAAPVFVAPTAGGFNFGFGS